MKKALTIVLALFLMAGVASAGGYEITKKAGEYDVTAVLDRNPPVAGNNEINLVIKDSSGNVVKDAQVKIEYSMPAMPGMPPMRHKTGATLQGDSYKAVMTFCMGGAWTIEIKIARAGKTSQMKFMVDAS